MEFNIGRRNEKDEIVNTNEITIEGIVYPIFEVLCITFSEILNKTYGFVVFVENDNINTVTSIVKFYKTGVCFKDKKNNNRLVVICDEIVITNIDGHELYFEADIINDITRTSRVDVLMSSTITRTSSLHWLKQG